MLAPFCVLLGLFAKIMELLWKFGALALAKWKLKWKSPLWNFIIARKTDFANAKREEFAEMLRINRFF
jgi:hypothetical protein